MANEVPKIDKDIQQQAEIKMTMMNQMLFNLLKVVEEKGLNFDEIEFSITMKNSADEKSNKEVACSSTIVNLNKMLTIDHYRTFDIVTKSMVECIKSHHKAIDEMQYFEIYEPKHYAWLISDEYLEYQKNELLREKFDNKEIEN